MKKLQFFFVGLLVLALSPTIFSCNTTGVSPSYYTRLQVVNTLAGSTPFNFYLNSTKKSSTSITFPASSGYVSVTPGTYYLQLSLATTPGVFFYNASNLIFKTDSSYSSFITGQSGSPISILIRDDLTVPSVGKAKIRFINTSYNAGGLDVTVNGTTAFTGIKYKGVGAFIEVPAGTYEFKANITGTVDNLATLSRQVLADGKIYTLYADGLTGSTTTNAAFGLTLLNNLPPATK